MVIKKGKHYANFLNNWPFIYLFKRRLKNTYVFTDSCRYTLPEEDVLDINKLFGASSLYDVTLKPFGIGIHKNSARFGWRYDPITDSIDLLSYQYINKVRSFKLLAKVGLNTDVVLSIHFNTSSIQYFIDGTMVDEINLALKSPLLASGLYFGGTSVAPHDISIIKK